MGGNFSSGGCGSLGGSLSSRDMRIVGSSGHFGGNFSSDVGGEDIWVAVLARGMRIFGWQFELGGEGIWVRWQF